ncbi:hypothetical protein [Paenibacillus sp. UNC451MF]|uniref:hypothetical protein n=1 Tax=Paenibacillus sp. UNC451MF TaxID=1449063 RepID=UPI0004915728|nr:hypothetical protein [Paenibacillus sp. UNC451MF]
MSVHVVEDRRVSVPLNNIEKTVVLRRYEEYCYQIAFFMLRNEGLAMEATKQTLTALYKCREWFEMTEDGRLAKAKQAALMHSLEAKKRG